MSSQLITALQGFFGSSPDEYTYPLYKVTSSTPKRTVFLSGTYSNVIQNGKVLDRTTNTTVQVPIPNGARASAGSDAQIIILNTDTGDEWAFRHASENTDGTWSVENGYHYNIHWSGVPPDGFGSRGAGVPYLAGLIRKCEVEQGHIDHAIAFAYDHPCSLARCASLEFPYFVFPATKSDGEGNYAYDFPEGTRLQLDPNASEADIQGWCGDDQTCRMIVKALQTYGMITIDNSGHPKIYPEDNLTANWAGRLTETTASNIPYSAFRVLAFP